MIAPQFIANAINSIVGPQLIPSFATSGCGGAQFISAGALPPKFQPHQSFMSIASRALGGEGSTLSTAPVDAFVAGGVSVHSAPELDVEGMTFKRGSLYYMGEKVGWLGAGGFGTVFIHPKAPHAVIKMVAPAWQNLLVNGHNEERIVAREEVVALALERTGVGPRYFGRIRISGMPGSVRERIFGRTVEQLEETRGYKEEEHALVLALIEHMATARLFSDDLHLRNIMIGHTLADRSRRAYFIEGDHLLDVEPDVSTNGLREAILDHQVVIETYWDEYMGWVQRFKPLRDLLDGALYRSTTKPFWQRIRELF